MAKGIGLITLGNKSTRVVRTCVGGGFVVDNKSFVSSQTNGKTHSVPGNFDAAWEISVYTKNGESRMPAGLNPGKVISLRLERDSQAYTMIIVSSKVEVSAEAREQACILLRCSANSATSYPIEKGT